MNLVLFADGGSRGNPGPAGIGALLRNEAGEVIWEVAEVIGRATNNVAEYRSLIAGLAEAARLGADKLVVRMDSQLVVRQMTGEYRVKNAALRELWEEAQALADKISDVDYGYVPRADNWEADALVNQALDAAIM